MISSLSPREQLSYCPRLLIKTIMGNAIPITWLFLLQPLTGVRFDGWAFWSIYGTFSLIASLGMWFVNRTVPDPTHQATTEVPSPILGVASATFAPLVFLSILAAYRMTLPS